MFKGKVSVYKNGKTVEKEFTDQQEYEKFIKDNNLDWWWDDWGLNPHFGLWAFTSFNKYLDNFFDRKLGLLHNEGDESVQKLGVDLNKYEQEIQKIEYDKTHKEEKKKALENTLSKLKEYEKKFTEEKKDEMIKQLKEDIKKVEQELKDMDK